MSADSNIQAIREEYRKINEKWLHLHFKIIVGLASFSVVMEIVMFFILSSMEQISASASVYVLKYILIPVTLNVLCIISGFTALRLRRLSISSRQYILSLTFVVNCFIVFSIHNIFTSLYLIFAIPILLTLIYASYRLTSVTAAFSLAAEIISECFISWDPDKISIFHDELLLANFVLSLYVLLCFYLVSLIIIRFLKEKNTVSINKELERFELQQKLLRDHMTGLYNRSALQNALCTAASDISGSAYIFAMADLDDFKTVNDTMGHVMGDKCLKFLGTMLDQCPPDVTAYRYGGDEFSLLFKNHTMEAALDVCSKIQDRLASAKNVTGVPPLSVSFGLTHCIPGTPATQLIKNADTALYQAKNQKNSICIYEDVSVSNH